MKILFLGHVFPEDLIDFYITNSKSSLDFAAHNLCSAIIQGFKENNQEVNTISVPHLSSFPLNFKTPILHKTTVTNDSIIYVNFFNFIYIKRFDIQDKVKKEVIRWCEKYRDEQCVVFIYSLDLLPVIQAIKHRNKRISVVLMVTDLPDYMDVKKNFVARLNKLPIIGSFFNLEKNLNLVDGFVLLAPDMIMRLPVSNKPWVQIEGIYNPHDECESSTKSSVKSILYTGDLGVRYGILDLLEAFKRIDNPLCELWICGKGDGIDKVKEYSDQDTRIKYFGLLPRKEVLRMQRIATVLINPRHSSDEYTRFSFPSKTLEYMASGTPTLMSHLKCIPDDYIDHLYFFDDETVEGYRVKITEILNKSNDELTEKGSSAANFIREQKMPKPQVLKIINLMKQLSEQ